MYTKGLSTENERKIQQSNSFLVTATIIILTEDNK